MNEKVIIVTAASKGIGRACAIKLAEQGCKLSLMSRSEEISEVLPGKDFQATIGDVGKLEDLEKLVAHTMSKFGRVDGVVNNTGHTAKGDLISISDQEWQQAFEIAFLNTVRMARLVTPLIQRQGTGSIVNISSFAAKEPSLLFPTSSVIRAALSNYAKLYATRFGHRKIRMNNVLPGYVDSYPLDKETIKTIPMGRPAKTEEIANLVAFLISDESSYINGQSVVIDGGLNKSF
ncbi:MAG TPA: SDR family oxidoreductase [Cyclobacteriaceae bacterium]|jgi:NAD(P)-dependent dehydrogenase (short-subunit alcohol dehydrogenase family)